LSQIHLLRCKALPLPQLDAFKASRPSADIVRESFLARPSARVPRGAIWHIGNTSKISGGGLFFALGREAVVKAQKFEEGAREFIEVDQAQAPFTVGVYDPKIQVAGVLVKQGVSLAAREVARKLQVLLQEPSIDNRHNTVISVDPILDPVEFVEILREAHRITRFEFNFSLPNPPDDDKYVQRPLKEYAKSIGATEGRGSFKGADLDSEPLIDLTRAIAAEGDQVTANVEMKKGTGITRRALKANAVKEPVDPELHEGTGVAILRALRRAYGRVRGENG